MSTKDQDFLLHIKKLMTDRNYVLVFSYFYPECRENHGKGGIFFNFIKENESKIKIDNIIKKKINRYIYFEGFLEKGIYLHYNIHRNVGVLSCGTNHRRLKNFIFSEYKDYPYELYDDPNEYEFKLEIETVSYDQAFKNCIPMEDIKDGKI